jgi:hypothetical protein
MKKLLLTAAIILGLATTTFADPNGGGLFKRGETPENSETRYTQGETPLAPGHGLTGNQNGEAPVGTGIVVLLGLGAAYLIGKKRNED